MALRYVSVTDEKHRVKFAEQDFFLWLHPAHNTAPRLSAPVTKVMVPQGGAVVLADDVVALRDPDDPDMDELVLVVRELPFAGTLQQQVMPHPLLFFGIKYA